MSDLSLKFFYKKIKIFFLSVCIFLSFFIACIPPVTVQAAPLVPIAYTIGLKILKGLALRKMIEIGHDKFKDTSIAQELSKAFKLDSNGIVTPIGWALNKIPFTNSLRKFALSDDGDIVGRAVDTGKAYIMFKHTGKNSNYVDYETINLYINSKFSFDQHIVNGQTMYKIGNHTRYDCTRYTQENFPNYRPLYSSASDYYISNLAPGSWYDNSNTVNVSIVATNMTLAGSSEPSNYPTINNFLENNIATVTVNNEQVSILNITNNNYYIDDKGNGKDGTVPAPPLDSVDNEEGETKGWGLWDFIKGLFKTLGKILDFILNLGEKILSFLWRLIVPDNIDLSNFKNIDNFSFSFFISIVTDFKTWLNTVDDVPPKFVGIIPNPFGADFNFNVDFGNMFPNGWETALDVIRTLNTCTVLFATILFIKNKFEEFFD